MRLRLASMVAGTVVLLAAATQVAFSAEHVGVAVRGPADWQPTVEYRLEIGPSAWALPVLGGGGGVVFYDTSVRVRVALVAVPACRTIVSFVADPGSSWVIRFREDGSHGLEDLTGQGLDTGPSIGPAGPDPCLPGTDTERVAPTTSDGPATLALLLGSAIGFVVAAHTRRRRRGLSN